ncbi:hypothetical protein AVEN_189379-1 [Araneus ventricosus]|uniref:RNase H type-1 domain-containing protein n=1 Tax=Araneus ventricosus TaxID=182803 RepID=A0A4Y1ZKW8_ARAVE|nr:hypothetical protein AVEN_95014-1 [Araneus ventricosus]GBL55142.1 hypothetical protein AVEN_189379-1 [Araneus ventricosus]
MIKWVRHLPIFYGLEFENKHFRLTDRATVFMAEIIAIKEAIEYTHERNLRKGNIIADFRSALMALKSPLGRRQILKHIQENIDDFIELHWVREHQGQLGNERADELATVKDMIDCPFNRSCVQLLNDAKRSIIFKCQERWDQSQKGRWIKMFLTGLT